jgi:pectate lyase
VQRSIGGAALAVLAWCAVAAAQAPADPTPPRPSEAPLPSCLDQTIREDAANVILRDLRVVGYNCTEGVPCGESGSTDAIVVRRSHHLWFDHLDVSDGSDGNMDFVQGTDLVTVSWTKFSYSSNRAHRLSNLLGSSNNEPTSMGKLRVTFHHNWWSDRVEGRMPYVRYGRVHVFNNLFDAAGNSNGVQISYEASVLTEHNHFIGIKNPLHRATSANAATAVKAVGNRYDNCSGQMAEIQPAAVFDPAAVYTYALDPVDAVEAAVRAGAGPRW